MNIKVKNLITGIYCNYVLRYAGVKKGKVLFIITSQCYDNCVALIMYLLKCEKNIDIQILADGVVYEKYRTLFKDNEKVTVISADNSFISRNYNLVTSQYVFFMHRRPFQCIKKREDQLVINLWHGSGYKDIASTEGAWVNGKDFDYVLVPGKVFVETKARFFSCDNSRVLPLGYPRYDSLFIEHPNAIRFREEEIGVGNKFIIWLPTFRKKIYAEADSAEANIRYAIDIPLLKNEEELRKLDEKCRLNNVKILVKRHPFQKEYICEQGSYSNILFMGNDDLDAKAVTLYELLTVTNGLISDYSSVAIDYMLLNRPMAFCLDDFEQYKSARGFVFNDPLKYMPGHHLYSLEDIFAFIDDIISDTDRYINTRKELMPQIHNLCDNYCERIWKKIVSLYYQ